MTVQEMSNEFDILYENISSGAAPNINDYEKSLFLTRAQDELVRMYYNGKNVHYDSFESNEEVRRYLDTLITTETLSLSQPNKLGAFYTYSVKKPNRCMFVIREYAENASKGCLNGSSIQVVPIIHEDLNRVLNDPFKRPNERKLLRYDDSVKSSVYFNLITKHKLNSYTIVYLLQPKPIIVADLDQFGSTEKDGKVEVDYTINGEYKQTETLDIPELLQRKVVNRAVELAKAMYVGDLNTTFAINARDL